MNYQTFDSVQGLSGVLDIIQNNLPVGISVVERTQRDDCYIGSFTTYSRRPSIDRLVVEFDSGLRWGIEYYFYADTGDLINQGSLQTCVGDNLTLTTPAGGTQPGAFGNSTNYNHATDSEVPQCARVLTPSGLQWLGAGPTFFRIHLITDADTIYVIIEQVENYFIHCLVTKNYVSRCQNVPSGSVINFCGEVDSGGQQAYESSPFSQYTDAAWPSTSSPHRYGWDEYPVIYDTNPAGKLAYTANNCLIFHRDYPRNYDDPDFTRTNEFPSIFGPCLVRGYDFPEDVFAQPDTFGYGGPGVSQYGSVVINDCVYWLHKNLDTSSEYGDRAREMVPAFELPFIKTLNIETVPIGKTITLPDGDYKVFPLVCKGSFFTSTELPEETPDITRNDFDAVAGNVGVAVKIT